MLQMKKLIPMLLLVGVPTNVLAEWTRVVTSSNGDTTYVDFATIRKKGNKVKMWNLADYKKPQGKFLSLLSQEEYDCEEETSRMIATTSYSGNMRTGEIIDTETYRLGVRFTSEESVPIPVSPGSTGETLFKIACGIK